MAEQTATFLRSGSVVRGGKVGKEMVGAEKLEPRATELRNCKAVVAEAMVGGT